MRLQNIIGSKAIRFFSGSSQFGNPYMPATIQLLQENFGFVQVPRSLEEYDASNGVKFFHGNFEGVTIDLLEIYSDGISVQTKTNTDVGDKFIDNLIELVSKKMNFKMREIPHKRRLYTSELEIILEKNISEAFEKFSNVCKIMNKSFQKQADDIPPVEMTGIIFNYDAVHSPHLKPGVFSLERRRGFAFDTNIYFATAPLPTDLHLETLAEIEKVL
jgi:hypothetical protein